MARRIKLKSPEKPAQKREKSQTGDRPRRFKRRRVKNVALPKIDAIEGAKWKSTTYSGRRWIKFTLDFAKKPELFEIWPDILKSEKVDDALVEVSVWIKYEDLPKFDAARATKILKSAFYLKPITPRVVNMKFNFLPDKENNFVSVSVTPLERVQTFVNFRNPINKEFAERVAMEVIKGFHPTFKGYLKEVPAPDLMTHHYRAKRRAKRKLKK